MGRCGFLVAWAALVSQAVLVAQGWDRLDGCEFFEGSHSDGDSVEVRRGGKHYVFRLYFVDCVEKNPASRARRAAQARYFGLKASETTATAGSLSRQKFHDRISCAIRLRSTLVGRLWILTGTILPFAPL